MSPRLGNLAVLVFAGLVRGRDFVGHGHLGGAGTGNHHRLADVGEAAGLIDPSCGGHVDGLTRLLVRNRYERQVVEAYAFVCQTLVDFLEEPIFECALVELDDVLVGEKLADQVAQSLVDDGVFRRFVLRAAVGLVLGFGIRPADVLGLADEGLAIDDRVFVGDFDVRQDPFLERRAELRLAGHGIVGDGDLVRTRTNLGTDSISGRDEFPGHAAVAGDQGLLVGLSPCAATKGYGGQGECQDGFRGIFHVVSLRDASVGWDGGGHDPPDGAVSTIDDEDRPDAAEKHGHQDGSRQIVLPNHEAHEPAMKQAESKSKYHKGTQETPKCQGSSPISFGTMRKESGLRGTEMT